MCVAGSLRPIEADGVGVGVGQGLRLQSEIIYHGIADIEAEKLFFQ